MFLSVSRLVSSNEIYRSLPTQGPGINHFSKEPWFLLLMNGVRNQDLSARWVYDYWSVIARKPYQQTELRNTYICFASDCVCVYYKHTHTHAHSPWVRLDTSNSIQHHRVYSSFSLALFEMSSPTVKDLAPVAMMYILLYSILYTRKVVSELLTHTLVRNKLTN